MNKRVSKPQDIRRRHAEEFKQSLVQRTLEPGASVAAIAQQAGVNANLLFNKVLRKWWNGALFPQMFPHPT